MNGYHTRVMLRDHGLKHRRLFIRQPLGERIRRWLRSLTFGLL